MDGVVEDPDDPKQRARIELRELLTHVFDHVPDIVILMRDTDVKPGAVDLQHSAQIVWSLVLDEAEKRRKLRALVEEAVYSAPDAIRREARALVDTIEGTSASPTVETLDLDRIKVVRSAGAMGAHQRLFSDHYDSQRQARYAAQGPAAVRGMRARLRCDLLFNRLLVLTDAQVLDGTLLHALALDGELDQLCEAWAKAFPGVALVEVRTRRDDLNASLLEMVGGGRPGGLKPFLFATIPAEMASEVKARFTATDAQGVTDVASVARALTDAGAPEERVAAMRRAWERWFAHPGLARCQRWDGGRFLSAWAEAFAHDPPDNDVRWYFASHWGRTRLPALRTRLATTYVRSDARALIDGVRAEARTKAMLDDVRRLELWYDRWYNHALATQHGCASEWTSLDGDPMIYAAQRVSVENIATRDSDLMKKIRALGLVADVSARFVEQLGALPAQDFVAYLAQPEVHAPLARWKHAGEIDGLRRALDALSARLASLGTGSDLPEWAEGNRTAVDAAAAPAGEITVGVRFVIDDASPGQRTTNQTDDGGERS